MLLLQAQLRTASVEFAGNAAVRRDIRGIVGIQEIQFRSAHLHLPGADPKLGARESRTARRSHSPLGWRNGVIGSWPGIVEWIQSLLPALRVDFLPKISLLVKQTYRR
jgi:hypothetical protein